MHYKFFQNEKCEYFPCHKGVAEKEFNCLFCYCPLYALGRNCGGNFSYKNERGIKDCSNCGLPHQRKNYAFVIEKLALVVEMQREKNADQMK